MGTISAAKLAGISLILGPVITVVCYFIQQLVIFADVEWGNAASWAAAAADQGPAMVATSIIVPLSLMMLVYGILFIANEIRGNGNGDALARYSVPLILIGMTGFVLSSGNFVAATIFPEPAAAAEAVFLAAAGMNGIGGIFFSLGFTAIFFAMASREEYNSMLANIAALVAVLAFVLSIIGFASTELGELMTQLVGVTYIVHTIYAVYIGRDLLTRE